MALQGNNYKNNLLTRRWKSYPEKCFEADEGNGMLQHDRGQFRVGWRNSGSSWAHGGREGVPKEDLAATLPSWWYQPLRGLPRSSRNSFSPPPPHILPVAVHGGRRQNGVPGEKPWGREKTDILRAGKGELHSLTNMSDNCQRLLPLGCGLPKGKGGTALSSIPMGYITRVLRKFNNCQACSGKITLVNVPRLLNHQNH